MDYLDLHTHQIPAHQADRALVCSLVQAGGVESSMATHRTFGIHPGWIEGDGETQWALMRELVRQPACVAIGEVGLDHRVDCPMTLQLVLFERQALLAEQVGKPLIIHCVKAWEELLACRKRLRPGQPWIIHGFRGKEALARQLLRQGLYLSFGRHFQKESARAAWPDRLFVETDMEEHASIRANYERIAEELGIDLRVLCDQIAENSAILRLKNTTFAPAIHSEQHL